MGETHGEKNENEQNVAAQSGERRFTPVKQTVIKKYGGENRRRLNPVEIKKKELLQKQNFIQGLLILLGLAALVGMAYIARKEIVKYVPGMMDLITLSAEAPDHVFTPPATEEEVDAISEIFGSTRIPPSRVSATPSAEPINPVPLETGSPDDPPETASHEYTPSEIQTFESSLHFSAREMDITFADNFQIIKIPAKDAKDTNAMYLQCSGDSNIEGEDPKYLVGTFNEKDKTMDFFIRTKPVADTSSPNYIRHEPELWCMNSRSDTQNLVPKNGHIIGIDAKGKPLTRDENNNKELVKWIWYEPKNTNSMKP